MTVLFQKTVHLDDNTQRSVALFHEMRGEAEAFGAMTAGLNFRQSATTMTLTVEEDAEGLVTAWVTME